MAMKILMLGGTGVIGRAICNEFCEVDDVQIYITTRQKRTSSLSNEHYLIGNALGEDFLDEVLKLSPDIIIDFFNYSIETFSKRYRKLLNSTSKYIFLSSARVYGYTEIINENSERLLDSSSDNVFLKSCEYSLQKAMQENLLLDSEYNNFIILRPYIIYGEGRLQLGALELPYWFGRIKRGKTVVVSEKMLNAKTAMTSAEDVAAIVKKIIFTENIERQIINIANPNSVDWKTILQTYVSVLRQHDIYTKICVYSDDEYLYYGNQKYQLLYDRYFDRRFDMNNLNSILGYEYLFKRETEEIPRYLNSYISNYRKSAYVENLEVQSFMDRISMEKSHIGDFYSPRMFFRYLMNM